MAGPDSGSTPVADGERSQTLLLALFAIVAIAAMLSGVFVQGAGRRIRPEHVAAPAMCLVFVLSQWLRRERAIRLDSFAALAAAWVLANALSSWLHAPDPAESYVHVVRFAILTGLFLTVANLPPLTAREWRRRLMIWLGVGAAELTYGLLVWGLARYGDVWLPGAFEEPGLAGVGVRGTQLERNLFGILAGTILAVGCYILMAQPQRGDWRDRSTTSRALKWLCAVSSVAVVVSLTRSSWVAAAAAAPLTYFVFERRSWARADRALLRTAVALPVLVGGLIGIMGLLPQHPKLAAESPDAARTRNEASGPIARPTVKAGQAEEDAPPDTAVVDRLASFGKLGSDFTVGTRIQDARWAIDDWLASPWLGRGTGAFAQIHGIRVYTEAWISNLVLHTLVDTGLVGLTIEFLLFGLVAVRTWRAARLTADSDLANGLRAMTLGLVIMMIAYQVTDGTWLAVFWIHLGLMVNGVYCVGLETARRATEAGTR